MVVHRQPEQDHEQEQRQPVDDDAAVRGSRAGRWPRPCWKTSTSSPYAAPTDSRFSTTAVAATTTDRNGEHQHHEGQPQHERRTPAAGGSASRTRKSTETAVSRSTRPRCPAGAPPASARARRAAKVERAPATWSVLKSPVIAQVDRRRPAVRRERRTCASLEVGEPAAALRAGDQLVDAGLHGGLVQRLAVGATRRRRCARSRSAGRRRSSRRRCCMIGIERGSESAPASPSAHARAPAAASATMREPATSSETSGLCQHDPHHGRPEPAGAVAAAEPVHQRDARPVDPVAEQRQHRGQHRQRAEHGHRDDEHRADGHRGEDGVAGEQQPGHRDADGEAGDHDGATAGARRRCRWRRARLAPRARSSRARRT